MKHQKEGIEFLKNTPRALLCDDPGLGKSCQSLLAAVEPVLIVAPAMLIHGGVWDNEIDKWTPNLDTTQISYTSLPTHIQKFQRKRGTVILDECHAIKNRKAKRTLAVQQVCKKADRVFLLTGTPIPNWAHEAFTLLQLLYPDEAKPGGRFGSYWRWVEEWFELETVFGRGGRPVTHHGVGGLRHDRSWEEFRGQNWGSRALGRKRDDVLNLPPLTEQTIRVAMTPDQRRVYQSVKKDFFAQLDNGNEIQAWSVPGQFVKLAQIATQVGGKGAKIDALKDLLTDRPFPALVVAHYRKSVKAAFSALHHAGHRVATVSGDMPIKARRVSLDLFNSGRVDVLVATIDTISEGLTLTSADQVIFLERSWRPSQNEQALRRIHRIGQTRPVSAIHLVTEKTLDERVLKVLAEKTDEAMNAVPMKEWIRWV